MIKFILVSLITFSLNSLDIRENLRESYVLVDTYGPSIYNLGILKKKYDLVFKDGSTVNNKYIAIVDENYFIKVYKKIKQLKRIDEFSVYDELTKEINGK